MMKVEVALMAKQPIAGQAKTRLSSALDDEQIVLLADSLLKYAYLQIQQCKSASKTLSVWPEATNSYWQQFDCAIEQQIEGDLGDKMAHITKRSMKVHDAIVFMGMDCPDLTAEKLNEVIDSLAQHEVVLIPALDGGYVCIAMKQAYVQLFEQMPWSQPHLLEQTLNTLKTDNINYQLLSPLRDIDEPKDLAFLPEILKEVIEYVG